MELQPGTPAARCHKSGQICGIGFGSPEGVGPAPSGAVAQVCLAEVVAQARNLRRRCITEDLLELLEYHSVEPTPALVQALLAWHDSAAKRSELQL